MLDLAGATPEQSRFLAELTDAGLLLPSGVPGVYGRGATFGRVVNAIENLITRRAIDDVVPVERVAFPPVMPRRELEEIGYLASFPHLAGTIFSFSGDEADAAWRAEHKDWGAFQEQTELVMVPAACYPSYPVIAARGPLGADGVSLDLGGSYVFRNEPSGDPARMQTFHQRELVRFGTPERVSDWREQWCERGLELLNGLGLEARSDVASDPFFGRTGRMLARSQRSQALKFEILVQIASPEPTAVASFNCHREHFASLYGLTCADGGPAHTACVGFGLERITLAMFRKHGFDPGAWPSDVRAQLWDAAA
ncbi:MAG: amino acid--[acyl-carrier-protein] ligase [Gaiellaceae bacterium]